MRRGREEYCATLRGADWARYQKFDKLEAREAWNNAQTSKWLRGAPNRARSIPACNSCVEGNLAIQTESGQHNIEICRCHTEKGQPLQNVQPLKIFCSLLWPSVLWSEVNCVMRPSALQAVLLQSCRINPDK